MNNFFLSLKVFGKFVRGSMAFKLINLVSRPGNFMAFRSSRFALKTILCIYKESFRTFILQYFLPLNFFFEKSNELSSDYHQLELSDAYKATSNCQITSNFFHIFECELIENVAVYIFLVDNFFVQPYPRKLQELKVFFFFNLKFF